MKKKVQHAFHKYIHKFIVTYFIDSNNLLLHKSVGHIIIAANAHALFNFMVKTIKKTTIKNHIQHRTSLCRRQFYEVFGSIQFFSLLLSNPSPPYSPAMYSNLLWFSFVPFHHRCLIPHSCLLLFQFQSFRLEKNQKSV